MIWWLVDFLFSLLNIGEYFLSMNSHADMFTWIYLPLITTILLLTIRTVLRFQSWEELGQRSKREEPWTALRCFTANDMKLIWLTLKTKHIYYMTITRDAILSLDKQFIKHRLHLRRERNQMLTIIIMKLTWLTFKMKTI